LLRRIFILSITSGAIVASTTLLMMILLLKGDIGKSSSLDLVGCNMLTMVAQHSNSSSRAKAAFTL
jgi:hypothetical protein